MLGAIISTDLVKDIQSVAVSVARKAELQFDEEPEEPWLLLEGQQVTFSCSALGGTPEPEILAYLGARELWEDGREEDRATFSFTPERADTGKFLRCSSQQTDHDGGLLFEGPQEITKEVTRKTAIQCLLSDVDFTYRGSSDFISIYITMY